MLLSLCQHGDSSALRAALWGQIVLGFKFCQRLYVCVCLCTQPCCVWPMALGLVSSAVETPATEGGHQTAGDRDTMGPHGNTATQ